MTPEHSFTGTKRGCLNFASSRPSTFAHTCPPKEQQKNQAEHSDVMVLEERGNVTPYTPYWLIVKHHGLRTTVSTIELAGGEKVLPVFGHAEEAETFLRGLGDSDWQMRETGAGELVSILFGPNVNVREVALDPLASGTGAEMLARLVSLGREEFVAFLMGATKSQIR